MNRRTHLEILGPVDTAFYYVDRAVTPMNLGALTIFEGKIPFEDFLKVVESRIYRIPVYQQRVIQAPLKMGQPSWVLDPDFYVGNHVFRIELPAPGSDEQLRETAGHLVSGQLDRSKPLWEIYLIEGLEGNRTGLLFKVHHCMVDGLSAVELFTLLMDLTPDPPPLERGPVYDPPYLPNRRQLITSAIRADLPNKWGLLKKIGGDVARLSAVMTDKEKRRQTLVGVANLINDNLSLIKPLPLNGENTGKITLGWAEFSLNEVRAIRANQHASVNDVMLTILGGGVELYLRDQPEKVKQNFMRVIVPVNIRQEDEKNDFGNRISVLPVDLPFGIFDPLERLRKIAEYSQIMKQSSLTIGLDVILTLPSLYPSFTQPLVWAIAPRAFSLLGHSWCTNVAGPQIPVYVLGHEMQQSFGFFPINPSMGLATVILSYNQKITMNLIADAGIIPDVLHLRDCLQTAYRRLREAANVPEMPPFRAEDLNRARETAKPSAPMAAPTAPVPSAPAATSSEPPKPQVAPPVAAAPPAAPVVAAPAPVQAAPAALISTPPTSEVSSLPTAETSVAPPVDPVPSAAPTPEAPVPSVVASAPDPVPASGTPALDVPVNGAAAPAPILDALPHTPTTQAGIANAPAVLGTIAIAEPVIVAEPSVEVSTLAAPAPVVETLVADAAANPVAETERPDSEAAPAVQVVVDPVAPAEPLAAPIVEAAPQIDAPLIAKAYSNGKSASEHKLMLFSEEWAQAYQKAINSNSAYRSASLKWDAGQLAFIIHASPRHGFVTASAVLLDLHRGDCRAAHNTPVEEARRRAAFVIEGDYAVWTKVLSGEVDALKALMRGSLRLSKGSMLRLLPFTQSAQELVHSAQHLG